jgi:hypothetical protein
MARELVYDEATMYDAEVRWEPDKYVQVGIKTHDGRSVVDHLASSEDPAQFTGFWGTFDRASVNRLIRCLRRARDSAFGRDE